MAINTTNFAADRNTCTVKYGEQSMEITYKPSIVTQERMNDTNGDEKVITFVLEALTAWDIRTGTKKLPINKKNLDSLPFSLVMDIFNAIVVGRVDPQA